MELQHLKIIRDSFELSILQQKTAYPPSIEVKTTCLDSLTLFIHQFIFDEYLSKFTQIHQTRPHFIYLNASHHTASIFITCLYLHYHKLLKNYALHTKHHEIVALSRYYNLDWLEHFYRDSLAVEGSKIYGPICQLQNRLVVIGPEHLISTQCPPYAKAFAISPCGQNWYVLCSPHTARIELWAKVGSKWEQLTCLSDRWCAKVSFQLAVANDHCLYVLSNGNRLECYHQLKREWHQIFYKCDITYTLAEQSDGSLPVTLVANNVAGQIISVTYNHHLRQFDQVFNNAHHNSEPSSLDVARVYYEDLVNGDRYHRQKDPTHRGFKHHHPRTLKQCVNAVAHADRSAGHLQHLLDTLDTKAKQILKQEQEENTLTSYRDRWQKIVVVNHTLYGRKELDTYWFIYKNNKWTQFRTRDGAELIWNQPQSKLTEIQLDRLSPDYVQLDKNQEGRPIEWFNSNISYPEPSENLTALKNVRAYKNPTDKKVYFITATNVSAPLRLFLDHLTTSNLSEKLVARQEVTFGTNGGLKHLSNGTHSELYTSNPQMKHRVSTLDLKDFVDRFTGHLTLPVLVGTGSLEISWDDTTINQDDCNVAYFTYSSSEDEKATLILS
nr:ORF116 [Acipenserid herpesvirus 1]